MAVATRKAAGKPVGHIAKHIYLFGNGKADGRDDQAQLLGSKGASLHHMTHLGLPVPPGFTITTEACAAYHRLGGELPGGLREEIEASLKRLEKLSGRRLGDAVAPLLVSVRSGAAAVVPGLMPTILNVGLTDAAAEGLARTSGNARFAYDCYRRLIAAFGETVMGVDRESFELELSTVAEARGVDEEAALDGDDLREIVCRYKEVYRERVGSEWPQDPMVQLERCIEAALRSWNGPRAVAYRRQHNLRDLAGAAVTVQAMVFGNRGEESATGVAFTRNPSTGENRLYGEFLVNAQGRDLVGGFRTPLPCEEMARRFGAGWKELLKIKRLLERCYRDVQDFEFTIEEGKLYVLQTRAGRRTASAAIRIAVEMVREKLIDEKTALLRIEPASLEHLLHPTFDPAAEKALLAKGLAASPGAAVGRIAFSAEEAEARAGQGEQVILVRCETDAADVGGMHFCEGILTSTGGMTSHAAVVARGMGVPCVTGAGELAIDQKRKTLIINGRTYGAEDWISINGSSGEVYAGQVPTVEPELAGPFKTLMLWADKYRTMGVRGNADTPHDAELARGLGAEGIGLCRTEHMFFDPQRIHAMREMILAADTAGRQRALAKLLPCQRQDFVGIFTAMEGLPVIIRLLDPPLHEFLPLHPKDQQAMAAHLGIPLEQVRARVQMLREMNPMLGHRGCRLAISYPEILAMQVRAIIEAACECRKAGLRVRPEIMIPLTVTAKELEHLNAMIHETAGQVMKERGIRVEYALGTMIEVPRAALTSDEIAAEAQFFSFGTNDLTQMTLGLSRDDAGTFLPAYLKEGILECDPFQSIDQTGVGQLMRWAIDKGRTVRPGLPCGICGEHGGDPKSIDFCQRAGLDYVSCSPFRVPIARLAAAQAAIRGGPGSCAGKPTARRSAARR